VASRESEGMTNKKVREYQPPQIMAFPPSLDDVPPPEHPAYFVRDFVAGLDLSEFYADYPERRGQPPYHPRMMVGVWLYGHTVGIRSSRKLEQAIKENLGFRVVAGDQQPDHWTLSDFRRRHHKALGDLFNQTVQAAAAMGLVKLGHVAVDGTKVKANASKHRTMSYGCMEEEEERLREDIERWLEEVEANDRAEDELYGDGNGWSLPPELADAEKRRKFIQKFMDKLEERKKGRGRGEARADRGPGFQAPEAEGVGRTREPDSIGLPRAS